MSRATADAGALGGALSRGALGVSTIDGEVRCVKEVSGVELGTSCLLLNRSTAEGRGVLMPLGRASAVGIADAISLAWEGACDGPLGSDGTSALVALEVSE